MRKQPLSIYGLFSALLIGMIPCGALVWGQEISLVPVNACRYNEGVCHWGGNPCYLNKDCVGAGWCEQGTCEPVGVEFGSATDETGNPVEILLPQSSSAYRVEFEVRISGWGQAPGEPELAAYFVTLDTTSFLGVNAEPPNPNVDLVVSAAFITLSTCHTPEFEDTEQACWPEGCPPEAPYCLENDRLAVYGCSRFQCDPFACCGFDGSNYWVGPFTWYHLYLFYYWCSTDYGQSGYAGTLLLDIPPNAAGQYSLEWDPTSTLTYLGDCSGSLIPEMALTPGNITLQDGACCSVQVGGGSVGCVSHVYQEDCQGPWEVFEAGKACDDPGFECPACAIDAHCADSVFCNGVETCDAEAGVCLPGSDPCTELETCDESADTCESKGACCDRANGTCVDLAGIEDCRPPLSFQQGVYYCADVPDSDGDGVADCLDLCNGVDDAAFGPECDRVIPTASSWGLAVLTLVLLVAAKLCFGHHSCRQAESP